MKGVADNLAASLEARCNAARACQGARSQPKRRIADVARPDGARETHRRSAARESRKHAVDLWRPFIEENAGKDLAKLERRDARPDGVRQAHAHDPARSRTRRRISTPTKTPTMPAKARTPRTRNRTAKSDGHREAQTSEAEMQRGRGRGRRRRPPPRCAPNRPTKCRMRRNPRKARSRWRPEQPFADQDEWGYKVHTTQFDEMVDARPNCAMPRN